MILAKSLTFCLSEQALIVYGACAKIAANLFLFIILINSSTSFFSISTDLLPRGFLEKN